MRDKSIIAILVYNIIVVFIFAALALLFSYWWIVLFGILFMCFPKTVKYHCRVCDGCGAKGPKADTKEEALRLALIAGWTHNPLSDSDYCPECRAKDFANKTQE